MDPSFPDSKINLSGQASATKETLYSDTDILVVDEMQKENIEHRNRKKAANHRRMIGINKITLDKLEIPYAHFFMSCDTDISYSTFVI